MEIEDPAQRNVFYHKQKKKRQSNIFNTNVKIFFSFTHFAIHEDTSIRKGKDEKNPKGNCFYVQVVFLILILYFFAVAPVFSRISNKNN